MLEMWWLHPAGWASSRNTKEQRDLATVNVDDCSLCHERGKDAPQGTANHELPSSRTAAIGLRLDPSQRLISGLSLITSSIDNI